MLLLESHILDDETKETIIKLYKNGYYLGIISNNSIRNVEYILKREDIRKYFKKVVISEEVRERKPNLKVYMKTFAVQYILYCVPARKNTCPSY